MRLTSTREFLREESDLDYTSIGDLRGTILYRNNEDAVDFAIILFWNP